MRLLHFADLHLGVERYGSIDPQTGLSSRLGDFLGTLDQVVNYALENDVHLVLFCGDAYHSREPTPTQQREFARRISCLASQGIAVVLLVGNHDQPQALSKATAVDIFDTLAVQHTIVADKPQVHLVPTRAGPLQVVALPWPRRSAFLAREEMRGRSLEEMEERMSHKIGGVLDTLINSLDAELPAVLASHLWVLGALPSGSERAIMAGGEPQIPVGQLKHPALSYVALGHIHRQQVLSDNPPVVYAGSLERMDFREEKEEKGFYVVELEGREVRDFRFHPVTARRFFTLSLRLNSQDDDPTATVIRHIQKNQDAIRDAVVRLELKLLPGADSLLREGELRQALGQAYYIAAISREVEREPRTRLGGTGVEKMAPLKALEEYLQQRDTEPQRARLLLEYGERLMREADGETET